jgi:hypothetical protein
MNFPDSSPHVFPHQEFPKVPGIDIASITSPDLILPDQLIDGLLYRATKMVIAGGSKSYKTWLLMHLAFCMSHNVPWLGFKTTRCHVGYCNLELKGAIFNDRLLQIQNVMGIRPIPGAFFVHHFRDSAIAPALLYLAVLESVKNPIYDVVIIDPVYKLLGDKDENSASDMAALMFDLERIAAENNASVIFGHHYPKGSSANKDPLDRLAGSGVFGRDLDSVMTLTPHREECCYTADFILRNHKPIDPSVLRWQYPIFRLDETLDPTKLRRQGGRPVEVDVSAILELLTEHDDSLSVGAFQELACEELEMSRRTFYRKWKLLNAQKKVFLSKLTGFVNQAVP